MSGSGQFSVLLANPSFRGWTPCRVTRKPNFTVSGLHPAPEPGALSSCAARAKLGKVRLITAAMVNEKMPFQSLARFLKVSSRKPIELVVNRHTPE